MLSLNRVRQNHYRSALQSQEYLKAKQKLNVEIKINNATKTGGTANSVYTFGGAFVNNSNSKSYIPPNPIVNPISDPMYNPYLRGDIKVGAHDIDSTHYGSLSGSSHGRRA
jgi:hypothetical protein